MGIFFQTIITSYFEKLSSCNNYPIILSLLLTQLFFSSEPIFSKVPKEIYGIHPTLSYQTFGPFYESETRQGQKEMVLRPFYYSYSETLGAVEYKSFLYPLFYSQKTLKWKKWSFLFIFSGDSSIHEDLGNDEDFSFTPLLTYGIGDTERERYFAVFPIYGNIRNKLSWSKIEFILFPLYTRWEYKDYSAFSILWPLTVYGNNDVRKEIRLLPFYSQKSHVGKYEHTSILWPFLSYGYDNLDKKEPSAYSFVWLLYAKKESYFGNLYSLGIMPVIGSISLFSYGYDKKTSEISYSAFFFLMQYGYSNDKDYRKKIFFPFYGYSRFASKEFEFITPFFYRMETDTYGIKSNSIYIVPFFHYNNEIFVKEEREELYHKFWPVYKWHRDREGTVSWNLLSPYPIRSETAEKVWDPLFSLVEYKNQVNGDKKFSMLFRIFSLRWNQTEVSWDIPLLARYEKKPESTSFKLFYGFLGRERTEDKSLYQFLWFFKL